MSDVGVFSREPDLKLVPWLRDRVEHELRMYHVAGTPMRTRVLNTYLLTIGSMLAQEIGRKPVAELLCRVAEKVESSEDSKPGDAR